MGMTYGELARLEQQLVDKGAVVGLDDVELVLRDIATFYSELAEDDISILDSTDFATLCEHVRSDGESRKRKLHRMVAFPVRPKLDEQTSQCWFDVFEVCQPGLMLLKSSESNQH